METNDCSVLAIAAVTGVPYATIREKLLAAGRRPRHGASTLLILKVCEELGFHVERVVERSKINQYPAPHYNLRSITTHHPERFAKVWADGNNYLFLTSSHVAGIVNGVNHDWTRGRAKRCESVYRVSKIYPTDFCLELKLAPTSPWFRSDVFKNYEKALELAAVLASERIYSPLGPRYGVRIVQNGELLKMVQEPQNVERK